MFGLFKKNKRKNKYTVGNMMSDIAAESIEANKLELNLQYYMDIINNRASQGYKFWQIRINPPYSSTNGIHLKPGQLEQLISSLKNLGIAARVINEDIGYPELIAEWD